MRIRQLGYMAALAAFSLSTALAAGRCQLAQLGSLPVEMHGLSPFVWTKINGVKARFELDSGSFYSTMYRDAAVQYQLPVTSVMGGSFSIVGVGGREDAHVTTVKSFEFLGLTIPDVQFLVIDQTLGSNSVGLLGQNVLRVSDVEYDLADGVVRFFKPVGCDAQPLAYWAVNTPYSSVELQYVDAAQPHLAAIATINGHRVTVWFDTGAGESFLSLDAAKRAGIVPSSPGVTFVGLSSGIGPAGAKSWSAPVDTFQLGGEKVEHTHLLIGDLEPSRQIGDVGQGMPDMLLGADFFLSHRIYVAYGQRKLYFTYNGGPLFNLNLPQFASSAAKPAGAQQPSSDAPTDADGFKRRGMAYASMREFDLALADLNRACDLAPGDGEDHYDRGVIYAEDGQLKSALQDYDTAITLQPDDIDAHMARAELLESHPDDGPADAMAQVKSDVDAVSRLAPPAADVRLTLSKLYGRLGDYPAAIDQLGQWLGQHRLPGDQAMGLNNRCWLRATANRDLHEALEDCNRALDLRPYAPENVESHIRASAAPRDPDVLDSRGLVYLRLGNLTDAVDDYNSALQINSNMPTALYGRGLAELRLGEKQQGQNDLAAAAKLDSGIAKRFAAMGLTP